MTETTLMLTIRHAKPLPPLYREAIEARAYDYITAKNVPVDVQLQEWLSVEEVPA